MPLVVRQELWHMGEFENYGKNYPSTPCQYALQKEYFDVKTSKKMVKK